MAAALLIALPLISCAIPAEIHSGDIAFPVPEGFEAVTPLTNESDVVRLFARRSSTTAEPDTWLTIRQTQASTGAVEAAAAEPSRGVLGRYSERLHGLDVAVLQDRLTTNDSVYLQSRAQFPAGSGTLEVDLKSRSLQDQEMKEIMRAILAAAAAQRTENQQDFSGWGAMFLCLVLAAALIIIACGRR